MASVNKVILVGNLGRDPEIRAGSNGGKIATLNLATSESRKDADGSSIERTEWHRVSIFGKLADVAEKYLSKGSSVFIEGRIRSNKWTDKAGIERYGIEIVCESLQMLGGRSATRSDGDVVASARLNNDSVRSRISPPERSDEPFDDYPF